MMGKTLRMLTKISLVVAMGLALPVSSAEMLKPLPESFWYNCLTREVWTAAKKAWCDRLNKLQNAQYKLPEFGLFKLKNGKYENAAQRKVVYFQDIPGTIVTGTIGSRPNLTTAILSTNTGGSGIFQHLVVTNLQRQGDIVVATQFLGDRVGVKAVTLDQGKIQVRLIRQGPQEPLCCPTEEAILTYSLRNNQLQKISEKIIGTVPLDPGEYNFRVLKLPTDQPLTGKDPLAIAKNLFGAKEIPSEGNFKEEIILIDRRPNRPVVLVTQTGLLDDSVEAKRYRLEFTPQKQQWRLVWAGEQNRCRPGRGSQDWTDQLCS